MINIAICDDQREYVKDIENIIHRWKSERNANASVSVFSNSSKLLDTAASEKFTLYLLDIIMPGLNGIEVAKEIRSFDKAAKIVFLTSSPSFAYDSYSVDAEDYLLKPVNEKALIKVLDKTYYSEKAKEESFVIKTSEFCIRIPYSELVYVEVINRHLEFNLIDGKMYVVNGTLNEYEEMFLSRPEYIKVHRAFIVNMYQIAKFSPSEIITHTSKKIPISRLRYQELKDSYMKLMFAKMEED